MSFIGVFEHIARMLAPGIEESRDNEIKLLVKRDSSFVIDLQSLRESKEVQRQIAHIRAAEEKRA